jgi:transposase-like protein
MKNCPACTTDNGPMGILGAVTHYRCRACGLGYIGETAEVADYNEVFGEYDLAA